MEDKNEFQYKTYEEYMVAELQKALAENHDLKVRLRVAERELRTALLFFKLTGLHRTEIPLLDGRHELIFESKRCLFIDKDEIEKANVLYNSIKKCMYRRVGDEQ